MIVFLIISDLTAQSYKNPVIIAKDTWAITGMTIDPDGNLFFCGYKYNNGFDGRIYELKKILQGYDPNPVLIATISGGAWSITIDNDRNLFCFDAAYGRIYKLTNKGGGNYDLPSLITSGLGASGMGLTIDKATGNLFSVGFYTGIVYEIFNSGGVYDSTPTAIATGAGSFTDITIDNQGNLFISSNFYGAVFCLPKVNGVYQASFTTIASGVTNAFGITIDECGSLFVPSQYHNSIYKIAKTNNAYNPVPNLIASGILNPTFIVVDNEGNLFSNNTTNGDIYMVAKNNPSVTISVNNLQVCANTAVKFSASVVNAAVESFEYHWKRNGTDVGTNASTYVDNGLKNNDSISCELMGISSCFRIKSNGLKMTVNSVQPPSISISTNRGYACPGDPIEFIASASDTANVTYLWKKNDIDAGTGDVQYIDWIPHNGDVITCVINSQNICGGSGTDTSNSISEIVNPNPIVSLDKTSTLCSGDVRKLDAGIFSSYLWSDGSAGRFLSVENAGTYYVFVTDNKGCTASDTATITKIFRSPSQFLPADTSICSTSSLTVRSLYKYNSYLWSSGVNTSSINITEPGTYWLAVEDDNQCKGRDTLIIKPRSCFSGFYIPNAFTPDNNGRNDYFRPTIGGVLSEYQFTIYNRWGQLIFITKEAGKGWDGKSNGILQDENVFIWTCRYRLAGSEAKFEKGTFILIR